VAIAGMFLIVKTPVGAEQVTNRDRHLIDATTFIATAFVDDAERDRSPCLKFHSPIWPMMKRDGIESEAGVMTVAASPEQRGKVVYLLLLAVQFVGENVIVWQALPAFRQLLRHPDQIILEPYDTWTVIGAIAAAQAAYWYRLHRVAIPFSDPSVIGNHLFLLWGRLNFIFGGGLFSVVIFRHLPEMDFEAGVWLATARAPIFILALFTMFCFSLELERLGAAFAPPSH
jgi:hypothetical protein